MAESPAGYSEMQQEGRYLCVAVRSIRSIRSIRSESGEVKQCRSRAQLLEGRIGRRRSAVRIFSKEIYLLKGEGSRGAFRCCLSTELSFA